MTANQESVDMIRSMAPDVVYASCCSSQSRMGKFVHLFFSQILRELPVATVGFCLEIQALSPRFSVASCKGLPPTISSCNHWQPTSVPPALDCSLLHGWDKSLSRVAGRIPGPHLPAVDSIPSSFAHGFNPLIHIPSPAHYPTLAVRSP